ncbi:hypothetical protein [Achromobacter sp. RTa]|uniref:hypothetical protein n=1 Tax=Achromobacter sp. RTa TaxID=1532557 RepID=UPI000A7DA76B|nr:hypothetical protein [Achromobacter sp. RTa]
MFIAHSSALRRDNCTPRNEPLTSHGKRAIHENINLEYPDNWKFIEDSAISILLHAPKYVEEQLINAQSKLRTAEWLSYLHTVDGPYLVVRISSGSIEISRSLYRGLDVFYTHIAGSLVFSTSPSVLLRLKREKSHSLDLDYCRRFILDRPVFSGSTAIAGIRAIPIGQSIRSNLASISIIGLQKPLPQQKGPIEILTKKLSTLAASFSSISLSFSGGLDSSALLHCLATASITFDAIHGVSPLPYADTERREAEQVAAAYGKHLKHIKMIESDALTFTPSCLKEPAYRSPFDVNIFLTPGANPQQQQAVADFSANELMITGHGGDHVFLQNPNWNVGFDRIHKLEVLGFFHDVKRFCTLKKANFYRGVHENLRLLLNPRGSNGGLHTPKWMQAGEILPAADNHYLLNELDPRSAKFDHVWSILLGLNTIQMENSVVRTTIHPLLLPDVIGTVMYRPVRELFSAQHDRFYFRRDLYKSAGYDFAWRKSKRSSSASLFNYFSENHASLFTWLEDGFIAKQLTLDLAELKKSLKKNGSTYLDDDFPALINLIQLEGFVQSVLHHSQ